MTEKQRRFAEAYARSGNATQAAKEAGYAEHTAHSSGQRLLKNAEIKKFLESLLEPEHEKSIATVAEIRGFLSSMMNDTSEKTSSRLKAAELLGRSLGMFLPDSAVTVKTDGERADVVIYLPQLDELPDENEQPAAPRLTAG